jgi:hypothetical protein
MTRKLGVGGAASRADYDKAPKTQSQTDILLREPSRGIIHSLKMRKRLKREGHLRPTTRVFYQSDIVTKISQGLQKEKCNCIHRESNPSLLLCSIMEGKNPTAGP